MNCHRAHQLVSPYLDHQLTGAEMLEIQRHLEGCRCCTEEYQTARHIKGLLRSLRVQEPVGPLEARIARRLAHEDAAPPWAFAWRSDLPRTLVPGSLFPPPQAGRRLAVAVALCCIALFAITPSFAPPIADVAARPAPLAFGKQAAFESQTPGTVLRASPAALSMLLTQAAPQAAAWRVVPTPPDPHAVGPDAPPLLVDVGAEPLGDPAADGYVALADYRTR